MSTFTVAGEVQKRTSVAVTWARCVPPVVYVNGTSQPVASTSLSGTVSPSESTATSASHVKVRLGSTRPQASDDAAPAHAGIAGRAGGAGPPNGAARASDKPRACGTRRLAP